MIHFVVTDIFNQAYEITDRFTAPRSSATQRHGYDGYFTFSLVNKLCVTPEQWLQILQHALGYVPYFHSNHPSAIYQAVTESVMRGDLVIYQLPRITDFGALRGKYGVGLCIIRGPNPHCATDLTPEICNNPATAKQLLNELGISDKAFLVYLNSQSLYNSYQKQNPLADALNLLSSGELLAYKVPMAASAPPPKAVEYIAATAIEREVPLAPQAKNTPASPSAEEKPQAPAPESAANAKVPPQTLEEASQRLIDAGPAVRAAKANNKPLPPSSYSLADKQAVVEKGLEEKFLVRVIETDYASDNGYIGKVRDHGQSISWTAPFSMVEHGDTDAEALLKAFGTRYDPAKKYTVLIIDRDKMNEIGDVQTIIPTKQNLTALIAENPHISTLSPDEVEQVLSDELAPKYYKFAKAKSKKGINSKHGREMQSLSKELGFSKTEAGSIIKRQTLADEVAAWEEFTGNGMTLDTISSANTYGPVEVVMLDKKPMKLGELRKNKAIKSLNC